MQIAVSFLLCRVLNIICSSYDKQLSGRFGVGKCTALGSLLFPCHAASLRSIEILEPWFLYIEQLKSSNEPFFAILEALPRCIHMVGLWTHEFAQDRGRCKRDPG